MSISLGGFISHKGSGIYIPLNINYDPSSNMDVGFGRGWGINLSKFDSSNNNLKLSTGQSFKIQWDNNKGEYNAVYRGLKDIRILYLSETEEIKIIYKDGKQEYLSYKYGNLNKVVTHQGLEVVFEYEIYRGRQVLWSIKDGSRQTIIDWWSNNYETVISHRFNNVILQEFTLYKYDEDRELKYFSTPEIGDLTTIEYEFFRDINYKVISRVTTATGKIEELEYRNGHSLPVGAPIQSIPYVYRYHLYSGFNQPAKTITYLYSDRNYLGFGSDRAWVAGEDTLFKAHSNYVYSTEEHGHDNKKTIRIYNKYHLLEFERFFDNDFMYQEIDYVYYANLDINIENQPAQYSMLKSKTNRIFSVDGEVRSFLLNYEYDEYANLLKEVKADGSTIVRTYYGLNSEQGCPASTTGIVSFLKQERFISNNDNKIKNKKCEYISIPTLDNMGSFIVLSKEILDIELYSYRYYTDASNIYEYGRIDIVIQLINGYSCRVKWLYDFLDRIIISEISTAHDEISYSITSEFDYNTMNIVKFIDENKVETNYCYDNIGRITSEIFAPGTEYEAYCSYEYSVGANNNSIKKTDFKGNIQVIELNNSGNIIRMKAQPNGMTALKTTKESWYNELGKVYRTDQIDWIDNEEIRISQLYQYDSFGEVSRITHDDGREEKIIQDPVKMSTEIIEVGLMSEISKFDLSGNVVEKITLDSNQNILAKTLSSYDGEGNVLTVEDTGGRITTFKYDSANRVTEINRTLDGDHISEKYEYPRFTNKSCVQKVTINNQFIGSRVFDGLLRITSETAASGSTQYHYDEALIMPSRKITELGEILFDLDRVTQQPRSVTVPSDISLASTYQFDKKLGVATSSLNADSRSSVELDSYGRTINNRICLNDGVERNASVEVSLLGRVVSEVDYFGNSRSFKYDKYGRVKSIFETYQNNKSTETRIFYDAFSRPNRYELYDRGNFIDLCIEYNSIGYETYRQVMFNDQLVLSISQEYNTNLLIMARIVTDESGTTTEYYEYDDYDRLVVYTCTGVNLPSFNGNTINKQVFEYDFYGNVTKIVSSTSDKINVVDYEYGSDNPVTLTSIQSTNPDYQANLEYDSTGNMLVDEKGHNYLYDALGRVRAVKDRDQNVLIRYTYDAIGKQCSQIYDDHINYLMYQHDTLINEVCNNSSASYSRLTNGLMTKRINADVNQISLGDHQSSTIRTMTVADSDVIVTSSQSYTPYGESA
ncbi:hypothetical protein VSF3289_00854 [Vibrio scophthalmi]|uniref:tRNA(Glu)-specific nuclease WapA n=2 Tax=Vibrio scophthalmi TaxID=45658 RepID=A0A1E3WLJ4_9VIBR|nr:hypothetical protein VSF3289_00854 [Vibrio scophthalmi]